MKIDPFYVLLLAELSLTFFVLFLFFFFRNSKHKKLYRKTLRTLNDLQSKEGAQVPESAPSEEATPPARPPESQFEQPLADSVLTESFEEGEESPIKLIRLQRMVNFQKKAILELMCYKDIFETARGRLDILRESNYELQEKVRGLFEGGLDGVGTGQAMTAMENNNHELEKFIAILDRENTALSGKFRIWEERFERIAVDAIEEPVAGVGNDAKYEEMRQGKEELLAKVREVEETLAEKDKNLEAMQLQYEDLEKEYMILYRQQQQQEQQQQEQQQQQQPEI
ncbi:MAG: hypothetical protein HQL09_06185 [Nitrospirae bacterium]|nr:hypothetical protein [Nitrospirota bacterium]